MIIYKKIKTWIWNPYKKQYRVAFEKELMNGHFGWYMPSKTFLVCY